MASHKENTLLVDSVHLEFGKLQVLQSAYITSRTGCVTGVLGRNGCGKSSLFKCIMGGIRPQNRFIRFNDEKDTDYDHIGERVKYLPQDFFIPPSMTLHDAFNIYGVDYDGLVRFNTRFRAFHRKKVAELSGGEARIAEIYLVLRSEAEFCILDEPFSNISPDNIEKIHTLIKEEKTRKGIIVSDHMYESIIGVSDDLYLLRDGYTFPVKCREDLIHHGYIPR